MVVHSSCISCAPHRPSSTYRQVRRLFPSAKDLNLKWHSVVKIAQSLYREVGAGYPVLG